MRQLEALSKPEVIPAPERCPIISSTAVMPAWEWLEVIEIR
jgi:hypothetical protein